MNGSPVFVTRDLRLAGVSYDEIRRNPHLTRLRRGAWVGPIASTDRLSDYLHMIEATYGNLPAGGVLSHASAAALHGLPVPYDEMRRVHVTRDPRHFSFIARHVRVRIAPLSENEITVLAGLPVTSLHRTLADIASTWSEAWAVAAVDEALSRGTAPEEIEAHLMGTTRVQGVAQARRVLMFADGRSGSPGESLSRHLIHQAGLPAPQLQRSFPWPGGIDMTDFDWDIAGGVIGEFDGYGKYVRSLPDGSTDPGNAIYQEKRREDRLRRRVRSFVRWGWAELRAPYPFIAELASALGRPYRTPGLI